MTPAAGLGQSDRTEDRAFLGLGGRVFFDYVDSDEAHRHVLAQFQFPT